MKRKTKATPNGINKYVSDKTNRTPSAAPPGRAFRRPLISVGATSCSTSTGRKMMRVAAKSTGKWDSNNRRLLLSISLRDILPDRKLLISVLMRSELKVKVT
jgi:hypothetical protein